MTTVNDILGNSKLIQEINIKDKISIGENSMVRSDEKVGIFSHFKKILHSNIFIKLKKLLVRFNHST